MELRPILSSLRRHKTAALLIVLEIAVSCAIVCNALFLIGARIEHMNRPSGTDEMHVVAVKVNAIGRNDDAMARSRSDLDALRALPGVRSAAIVGMVPFGNSNWSSGIKLQADQQNSSAQASNYMVGEDALRALGLKLVAGRDFNADEYVDIDGVSDDDLKFPSVILSQSLARKLFPDGNAIGRSIYVFGDVPHRVVGVVERLAQPRDNGKPATYDDAMLLPGRPSYRSGGTYLLNVADPTNRQNLLDAAKKTLAAQDAHRILNQKQSLTLQDLRERYYRKDRAMVGLLIGVSILLLLVTALGIIGLASFWVQQRTKQIGIRRALGATRNDILRYFQTENFLLASGGIVLGMLLAFGINQLLMSQYELPRLPWFYLPVGAVLLWTLGQLAVLGPALRAAAIPPVVATRSA